MTDLLHLEHSYADELDGLYTPFTPPGFPAAQLVALNAPLAAALGLDADALAPQAAALLSGTAVPPDAKPLAMAYAGHQFGHFSPRLGDGRALLLGELRDPAGRTHDLHLKGSGRTPYSRGGDGLATLGPVLREYLLGEAMFHLGVPTTRALAALTTGQTVQRTGPLPGAVLARIADSHLRVGTLQFFSARGEHDKLERVVHYALARHYPALASAENPALALLNAVADAQAHLIAKWMLLGFIHGVMNTDNVTLSGQTIDYGPCAFLDKFDPDTVYSSIDRDGRYAYGNQPAIGQWNLARMAEALLPMLSADRDEAVSHAQDALARYARTYEQAFLDGMRQKLGLQGEDPGDLALATDLLEWMADEKPDYTLFFRELAASLTSGALIHASGPPTHWRKDWQARLGARNPADVAAQMNQHNPLYIPRNHLVEEALDAAVAGDLAPFHALLAVLSAPYTEQPDRARYTQPAPADFGPYQTFCGT